MRKTLTVSIGKRNYYGSYEHVKNISIGMFVRKSTAIKKSVEWLKQNSGNGWQYESVEKLMDVCSFSFWNAQITNDVSNAI